jgi:hypothetical protein
MSLMHAVGVAPPDGPHGGWTQIGAQLQSFEVLHEILAR